MTIRMNNLEGLTLDEMEEWVASSRHIGYAALDKEAIYGFIERILKAQQYRRLSKGQKGIVRRFLANQTTKSEIPVSDVNENASSVEQTKPFSSSCGYSEGRCAIRELAT